MTTPDPRTLANSSLMLGVAFLLAALLDIFALGEPIHVSSPWPAFDTWILAALGNTGIRLLVITGFAVFGAFFVVYGWRALTPQSRTDGPRA
jgi:hypothetical protein